MRVLPSPRALLSSLARLLALAWLVAFPPPRVAAQSLDEAVRLARGGSYEEALSAFATLARGPEAGRVLPLYARTLLELGRYEEAQRLLEESAAGERTPQLLSLLGDALWAQGKVEGAESAYREAMRGTGAGSARGRLGLAILLWNRGDRDEALSLFDTFIDLYNESRERLDVEELLSVGTAVRYLGVRNPALYQDALMAYDEAAASDPSDPRPPLLIGELFLEKYRATDARASIREVLDRNPRNPRALLDQARILDFEGVGGARELVDQALEVAPGLVEGRVLLASLLLKTEEYEEASREAERALERNPRNLPALSLLAAARLLTDDTAAYEEVRERIRSIHPRYAGLYITVAEMAANRRMYRTAVEFAGRAVEMDSTSWRAHGVLGMNQLRVGEIEAGRASLERAFAGDPYNPWYKNTLDLLDTFSHYREVRSEHFRIFLHEREAELLGPYFSRVAEEAFAALEQRYEARPPLPIRLEVYPSHADFSVRTLGLTGLGALGVSFGSTLVMDSPSAQEPGSFNWASTLWHEVAHAFHLAMSDHHVPRWFTEGLAVHEQHVARPGWGFGPTPAWLQAFDAGRLPPVSRLNEGFVRPAFPEQVAFSYYEASLVFELIESRWGLNAIRAMLAEYRKGAAGDQVFQNVLGLSLEEFDRLFETYVRERWGERMKAVAVRSEGEGVRIYHRDEGDLQGLRLWVEEDPGNFLARLALGKALLDEGRAAEAEAEFRAALALFPEYGGPDSPYLHLARIHRERGEVDRALRALERLGDLNETLHTVYLDVAALEEERGNGRGAASALARALEIVPFEVEVHVDLAESLERLGEFGQAAAERRAVLALRPADRAEAHYRLAADLFRAGEREAARSAVLRALEIAPNYEEALELLLRIRGGGL